MANVLNRTTRLYLESVNTPDYPTADWIISPDLSAVVGLESKYWVIAGDSVRKMTRAENDAVVAADLAAAKTSRKLSMDALIPPTQAEVDTAKDAVDAAATETDVQKVKVR